LVAGTFSDPFQIFSDPIRLWHIGQYAYGWEDAGSPQTRYQTYEFRLSPPSKEPPRSEIP